MKYLHLQDGVRLKYVPESILAELEEKLTYANPAYEQALKFSPYGKVYAPPTISLLDWIDHVTVRIPRGFNFSLLRPATVERLEALKIQEHRTSAPVVFPRYTITLNKEQALLVKATRDAIQQKTRPRGNYLYVASTSTGKTIAQATIASLLGERTLVLCKTNLIRKAWQDDLKLAFGIDKKDVGLIQQQSFTIGKHFTVSSLATLHKRKHRWAEIFAQFGTIVMDEVHLLPANQIYSFLKECPAKNIVGATATLARKDKKEFMIAAMFGSPLKTIEATKDETASSMPITDATTVPTNFYFPIDRDSFDYHRLQDRLIGDDERNDLIVRKAMEDWKDPANFVLITTSRVAHAQLLVSMLEEAGCDDVNLLTGAENANQKKSALLVNMIIERKIRMLVSTDQLISTGANINPLNRLHVAMPIKDPQKLKQLLGRIRRKSPGKKDTMVRYYLDARLPYLNNIFKQTVIPVFRDMNVKRWANIYMV